MLDQVNLQFAPGVDLERGKASVAALPGVVRVRQVFPDEREDEELLRMFVVDIDPEATDTTVAELRRSSLVEEVELAPRRGIRPRGAARDEGERR